MQLKVILPLNKVTHPPTFDMIEISCFYIDYNHTPINITFIKYDKFIKVFSQGKSIVVALEYLSNDQMLFQFYILSLLCTENTSRISRRTAIDGNNIYGVSTEKIGDHFAFTGRYDFIALENKSFKNPFLSQEPKRETSIKKQLKFLRTMHNNFDLYLNVQSAIQVYQNMLISNLNIDEIIEYEKRINLLCCIRRFNRDIYSAIRNFL